MLVSVDVTYSAVCLPGRTEGMAAPLFFSCSDRSFGSSWRGGDGAQVKGGWGGGALRGWRPALLQLF